MMIRKNFANVFGFISVVFFIGACAGPRLEVEPIAKSVNPSEQINHLEKDIEKAALLNGKSADERMPANTLLKIVERGR